MDSFSPCHMLMSFSVDETLPPGKVNLSTSFNGLRFTVDLSPPWLKHMYSVLSALTWRPMPPAAGSRLCSMGFGLGLLEGLCDRRIQRP